MAEKFDPIEQIKILQNKINKKFEVAIHKYKKPFCHITQNTKNVAIEVKLPGIKEKDVVIIDSDDKRIDIRVNKKSGGRETFDGYFRRIALPPGLKIEETNAELKRETLFINVPKGKSKINN